MGEQRNLLLFIAISVGILLLYQTFVVEPAMQERRAAEEAAAAAAAAAGEAVAAGEPGAARPGDQDDAGGLPSGLGTAVTGSGVAVRSRDEALAEDARVAIASPAVSGSLNLRGARFDDLQLERYAVEVNGAERVTLLNPAGGPLGYYAFHGWAGANVEDLPGPTSRWTLVDGGDLTPQTPVRLRYESTSGLVFLRTVSMDEDYLFTITDEVSNRADRPLTVQQYGVARRNELPEEAFRLFILHEGMVGRLDDKLVLRKYRRIAKPDESYERDSTGGWLGITDKYWMTALIPPQQATFRGEFTSEGTGDDVRYFANYLLEPTQVPAGETIRVQTQLFAGAKRADLMSAYRDDQGIPRFDQAIDWGNFWFLTKPFFAVLHFFGEATGNFGVALLILTVLVKAVFFPLANQSYRAMAKMKKLQPQMQAIREKFKDQPQELQKEWAKLYQKEKVNPLAGCLPLIPQMIVFFALYKTLVVTLEMRHAPFFGWIQDLSARDPSNMWNLFGLLPYDPASVPLIGGLIGSGETGQLDLGLGLWPLLMGLTMAALQTLNPPPPDKMQARIFAFMPIIFTFVLAPWAAGLVIYWTWNNILTFAQQYAIMRNNKVDTPLGLWVSKRWTDGKARYEAFRAARAAGASASAAAAAAAASSSATAGEAGGEEKGEADAATARDEGASDAETAMEPANGDTKDPKT